MSGDNFSQQEQGNDDSHKWGEKKCCVVLWLLVAVLFFGFGFFFWFLIYSFVVSLLCSIIQCNALGITN